MIQSFTPEQDQYLKLCQSAAQAEIQEQEDSVRARFKFDNKSAS